MPKNMKYQSQVTQVGSSWQVQIVRQVTAKKTQVTKQQGGFESELKANEWATVELKQLLETLVGSNQRHNQNRKQNVEIAQQRSSRRAEKTALAKAAVVDKADGQQETSDDSNGMDPEINDDFDAFSEES